MLIIVKVKGGGLKKLKQKGSLSHTVFLAARLRSWCAAFFATRETIYSNISLSMHEDSISVVNADFKTFMYLLNACAQV